MLLIITLATFLVFRTLAWPGPLLPDPPIAALMLHRNIDQIRLTIGDLIQVNLPPGSLRIFKAR